MAFDLNKNDGSVPVSSGKNPVTSKFDLSKSVVVGEAVTEHTPKSKTWLIGLVGILVVGAGIWYYSSHSKTANPDGTALTEVVTSDSGAKVTDISNAKIKGAAVSTDTADKTASVKPANTGTPTAKNAVATPLKTVTVINDVAKASLNNKIPVTFNRGASSFKSVNQSLVKQIVSYLNKNPAVSIHVNGYASSDGSLEINQTISQARADVFKKYLMAEAVADNRIIAVRKGIEDPIASNDTNAGRKKNRRVEVTLP